MERRIAKLQLEQQRQQEWHGAGPDAAEQVADQPNAEVRFAKERKLEQRRHTPPCVRNIEQRADDAHGDQRHAPRAMRTVFERQREGHHAQRQQPAAKPIEWRHGAHGVLRQIAPYRKQTHETHRHVDQENPVPRDILHKPAAQGRPQERANLPCHRHEGQGGDVLLARNIAQHRQPANRQQHRSANPLQHACDHQLRQRVCRCAEHRTENKNQDRGGIHAPRTELVRQPPRCWRQHGHGQRVGHHHRFQVEGLFTEAAGHGGQRGIDDRCVQRLHEEAGKDNPQHGLLRGALWGSGS